MLSFAPKENWFNARTEWFERIPPFSIDGMTFENFEKRPRTEMVRRGWIQKNQKAGPASRWTVTHKGLTAQGIEPELAQENFEGMATLDSTFED